MKGDGKALERRAVYCAHPNFRLQGDMNQGWEECVCCGSIWEVLYRVKNKELPRVIIGYIGEEDGRDGG